MLMGADDRPRRNPAGRLVRRQPGGESRARGRAARAARSRPARRRRRGGGPPHRPRQAARPRPDRPPRRSRLPVPRAVAARRLGHVRRRGAVGRHRDRDRRRRRARGRDRRQRRHRQGRHLLPDDGQEAPPAAGDRGREPPAVRLPRRLGRRVPAAPGGRVPRSRALRPDLLQPGQPVGRRDRADRRGHGLLHRGRRLRAGDERRDGHRQGHGHDLHRRPAAGEGRDRRGGRAPRTWAAPTSTRGCRASPTTSPTTTSTPSRSRAGSSPTCRPRARPRRGTCSRRASRCTTRPSCTASCPPTSARRSTSATSSPGSSTAATSTSSRRATARRW